MCIFCKIVRGEAPAYFVYEGERVVAFLDRYPFSWGHVLIVPKEHYKDIFEVPDDLLQEMALVSKAIAKAVRDAVKAPAIKILMNNGREAGQEVFHAHVHVIPYGVKKMNRREITEEEGNLLSKTIRSRLGVGLNAGIITGQGRE